MPAEGGEAREMVCNTNEMNSWHSWSPNGKWMVFASKEFSPYTQLFLTHIDDNGSSSPPVLLSNLIVPHRAANIPEFVNIKSGGIKQLHESFMDYYSYMRQAEDFMEFKKYKDAERLFKKSLDLKPNFANAHHKLGILLRKMNRLDDAEQELGITLELEPQNPEVIYNLGQVYLDQKKQKKAQEAFRKTIGLDAYHAYAYEALGIALVFENKPDEARIQLKKAIELDPDLNVAHYNLGIINLLEKNFIEARKEFETVLKIVPNNLPALHNLGIVYMNTREYTKAEGVFRSIYSRKPDDFAACMMLGTVLSKNQNSISEAISMYRKAQSLNPQNALVYVQLGNLYLHNGRRMEALGEYEHAVRLDPNLRDVESLIGRLKSEGQS